jgi:hypothetical protein
MSQSGNDAFKDAEKLNEFVNNPKKYISKWEESFHKAKEHTKESIKKVLPQPVKPIMDGTNGDIILLVLTVFIAGILLKVLGIALRIIFKIIFIVSIIAALYIILQKFFNFHI